MIQLEIVQRPRTACKRVDSSGDHLTGRRRPSYCLGRPPSKPASFKHKTTPTIRTRLTTATIMCAGSHQAPHNPYASALAPLTEVETPVDSCPRHPTSIFGAVAGRMVRGFRFGSRVSGGTVGAVAVIGLLVRLVEPRLFPEGGRKTMHAGSGDEVRTRPFQKKTERSSQVKQVLPVNIYSGGRLESVADGGGSGAIHTGRFVNHCDHEWRW
jgi:hypothetical protein